jgi:hypothetical protein
MLVKRVVGVYIVVIIAFWSHTFSSAWVSLLSFSRSSSSNSRFFLNVILTKCT